MDRARPSQGLQRHVVLSLAFKVSGRDLPRPATPKVGLPLLAVPWMEYMVRAAPLGVGQANASGATLAVRGKSEHRGQGAG